MAATVKVAIPVKDDNKVGLRLFNVKAEVMQRGDVITKVLALVALNVARFVIVSPMSSRTFAEIFLPNLPFIIFYHLVLYFPNP